MKRLFQDRLFAVAAALIVAVGITGGLGAVSQLERPFPGFLLLENGVVASVGLSIWPGTAGGEIFQHRVVSADGRAVTSAVDVRALVSRLPVATPVAYELRRGERSERRVIETRRFGVRDFMLLYGMYAVNGIALGAAGLVALGARRRNPTAACAAPALLIGSLWTLSALDLYGPYRLFGVHAMCEALLGPAALHMALGFPQRARLLDRFPWLPLSLYAAGLGLGGFTVARLDVASAYTGSHLVAVSAFGASLLVLVISELERFRTSLSVDVRARLRTLALGAALAFGLPISLTLAELLTGGSSPANALALTAWIFPASVAYAAARGDLLTAPRWSSERTLGASAPSQTAMQSAAKRSPWRR